jgi:hypothetical protein
MDDSDIELNRDEYDALAADITDTALEAAACSGPACARAFTVSMCTGQLYCPF